MTAEVTIKHGARLTPHSLRAAVLGEVHARPFTLLQSPRRLLHFGFETTGDAAKADRAALAGFCARREVDPLRESAKQHRVAFGGSVLRWEQHSEFTTYTWELPGESTPFHPTASALASPMAELPQPGPVLVALDLHLVAGTLDNFERLFEGASLAVAETNDGDALFATDFQPDTGGFVRILVLDRGLSPERAGALAQRLIELETYRTLALLGLPEAQQLSPSINRIERRLAELTDEMRRSEKLIDNHRLLDELTALAAELEAAPRRACSASGPAAPMTKSCKCGSLPMANGRSTASRPGARFLPAACSRRCAPAPRWKSGRQTCRKNSRARPICCARASMSNWSSRTGICCSR
jgi:uncharacterized membrane-anchored protein